MDGHKRKRQGRVLIACATNCTDSCQAQGRVRGQGSLSALVSHPLFCPRCVNVPQTAILTLLRIRNATAIVVFKQAETVRRPCTGWEA